MAPAENPKPCEDATLATVADLVRSYLPVRDLVRYQLVSKEWQTWCIGNATPFRKVQKDWYFPTGIRFRTQKPTWFGLHHDSEMEHRLPDFEFLSARKIKFLTAAGGLLLLRTQSWEEDTPSPPKLVVCNPLTRKWRDVPILDRKLPKLEYMCSCVLYTQGLCDVVIHMVVDAASGTYEILMMQSPVYIFAFSSRTNEWRSISPHRNLENSMKFNSKNGIIGSLYSNGRIYALEIVESQRGQHVAARVYLVASRRWLPDIYPLHDEIRCCDTFVKGRAAYAPSLVAILGDVYAVLPGLESQARGRRRCSSRCIQPPHFRYHRQATVTSFEIFKLEEGEKKFSFCATLPLQVTFNMKFEIHNNFCVDLYSWYTCAANGTVIWVACEDRLIQFDVVTGSCKMQVQPEGAYRFYDDNEGNPMPLYEPSFHICP
ncbi:hypothetical protein KC19_12G129600 [Ceratodon purpureus]|uniref:KIB1-4 beta-propeller domain-containing protein n=1 Tax=Ceratodon purpureus TaxID=3225 RepID=A0A8T0G6N0_CERPU|nr:hypothetical protein KC19_12G129600 [Ceratodon purpureus]